MPAKGPCWRMAYAHQHSPTTLCQALL